MIPDVRDSDMSAALASASLALQRPGNPFAPACCSHSPSPLKAESPARRLFAGPTDAQVVDEYCQRHLRKVRVRFTGQSCMRQSTGYCACT